MQSRAVIVDDEPAVADLIHAVLVAAGMEVLALTNSTEAAEHLRREKFAVALFDLCMPPPDGLELARQARRSGINQMTPIILVSDDQSTSATAQGFAAGASFFFYKPIDKARLLTLVRVTQGVIEYERRRFRRVPLQARVRIRFEKEEWDCETVDVSLNGMLIKSPVSLAPGASVRISLYLLPHTRPIVGSGSVVRLVSGNGIGIQLNHLTVAESGRLQDFLLPLIHRDGEESGTARA